MARQLAILVFLGFALAALASLTTISNKAAAATTSTAASAPPNGLPPSPPPEAIAACKGKAEGAQVSFTGRNGETLSGVCQLFNGTLAARPAGGGGRPPPPR